MFRKPWIPAFGLLCLLTARGLSAADAPPATSWIADDAAIVLEVTQPKVIIDKLFDDRIVSAVTSHPAYKDQMARQEVRDAVNAVNILKAKYDTDFQGLLTKLLGGGITIAIGPGENALMIVESEDEQVLNGIHDFLMMVVKNEARNQGDPSRVKSAEYRGVTGWRFAPNEAHAIIGNRLVVSNSPEHLKATLDLRAEPSQASLSAAATYRSARDAAQPGAVATLYANMDVLRAVPQFAAALKENRNPMGMLLFAPLLESLQNANWMTMGLDLEGDKIKLDVVMDGVSNRPDDADHFATPATADDGAMPALTVPRQIAAMSLYRDLHEFYSSKDELFPERTSGIIFFENMMGIFFTGRDLTEEVLAAAAPEVRLVVAEQQYEKEVGTPQLKIPGFAAVLRMKDPQKFAPIAEEAWQKALGLINFTRGQQALPGLIIDRETYKDVKYTTASFSAADEKDRNAVDVRFNFQPAIAAAGNHLILSSSNQLTKDLIDSLAEEDKNRVKPVAGEHSIVQLDGGQLASILDSNRDTLVRQNMVEKGSTREEADKNIGMLINVVRHLRTVSIRAGSEADNARLSLEVDVILP
jgi:hypothetical protein